MPTDYLHESCRVLMHSPLKLGRDSPIDTDDTQPPSPATESRTHGSAVSTTARSPARVTGNQPRLAYLKGATADTDPYSATRDAPEHLSDGTERVPVSTVLPELALSPPNVPGLSTILAGKAPCTPCRIHACGARLPALCTMHVDDKLDRRQGTSGPGCVSRACRYWVWV